MAAGKAKAKPGKLQDRSRALSAAVFKKTPSRRESFNSFGCFITKGEDFGMDSAGQFRMHGGAVKPTRNYPRRPGYFQQNRVLQTKGAPHKREAPSFGAVARP